MEVVEKINIKKLRSHKEIKNKLKITQSEEDKSKTKQNEEKPKLNDNNNNKNDIQTKDLKREDAIFVLVGNKIDL